MSLRCYCPTAHFNVVEQAVSCLLKAVIKVDIPRPEIQAQMNDRNEARRQGISIGTIMAMKKFLNKEEIEG